ncbi:MAG: ATP synthase F0 subunit B [Lachnospiraceae bacterium]|nr:ATP synthase F0 subunit B [Lachnospiraceae bacterium]
MGNLPLNIDVQQILLHLLNFAILFGGLYFILYKPVRKILDAREEHFKHLEEEALGKIEESEKAKEEYAERLKNADSEINAKKEAAGKETFAERERIIGAANDEAAKILKKAREKAQSEHDRIINDAQKEIADIVNEATEKIVLRSDLDTYDQFLNAAKKEEADE